MGPQLMLTTKDCMQDSRLRENFVNKGIDGCTFYGGKNSGIKRQCDQFQLIYKTNESEIFHSPKRSRVNGEDSPVKSKETSGKCFQAKSSAKCSLLSILDDEDEARTPVVRAERRGHTWKVKSIEEFNRSENARGRRKSLGMLRETAMSSNSRRRQFGRVLPKMYGSARQCLDFGNSLDAPLKDPPKVSVSNVDFTDDDDKENIDSEAMQCSSSQLNIEGIIESLGDVDYSPIKPVSVAGTAPQHELFEDERAGTCTSPTAPLPAADSEDRCNVDEEPHQIGFPNPAGSNKCWMNATLQSVLGLEPLVRDVGRSFLQLEAHMRATGTAKVLNAFLLLVRSRLKGKMPVVRSSLLALSRTLGFLDRVFLGKCQQDAAEFLVRLLDCFRDEFEKAITAEQQIQMEKISLEDLVADEDKPRMSNPVVDNVGFTLKETSCCTRCGESADKRQEHLVLFVDIPGRRDEGRSPCLQDAIDDYMKADTRELTCGRCGNHERSVLTSVHKLPRCLIVQVKRYTVQNSKAEKLADALTIPLVFSLKKHVASDAVLPSLLKPEFSNNNCSNEEESMIQCDVPVDVESDCDDEDKDLQEAVRQSLLLHGVQEQRLDCAERSADEQSQAEDLPPAVAVTTQENTSSSAPESVDSNLDEFSYGLVGAVSHYGLSPNSGHYVADVYGHQRGKWYHYDDEVVRETCDREVTGHSLQCNGYIFLYMYRPLLEQLSAEERSTMLKTDNQ